MRKIVLAALVLTIPLVASADAVTDAVKARQDHMKERGKAMGAMAAMAKGEVDYDPVAAQAAADALVVLVNTDTSAWWVPGSSSEDLPGVSRALPAVWTDGAKIGEIAGQMAPAAATLQAEAGKGRNEMAAALGGVGNVCQDCHKGFQAEKTN